jgi:LacI family transcriptional regulator
MAAPYEVAVVLSLNKDYDRKVAAGISRYAHEAGNWRVYLDDEPANRVPDVHDWRGHGVIADLDNEQVLHAVLVLALPTVEVGGGILPELVHPGIATVMTDDAGIARLAAEHLLERGLRHFAYCGIPSSPYTSWSSARERAFRGHLAAAGFACAVFHGHHRYTTHWNSLLNRLAEWLRTLSRPVGLMACDDRRARHVLLACRRAGVRVPEDVAVIGVDNDETMCQMVDPTLTSVEQGAVQIGYRAAGALDRMMRSRRRITPSLRVPPVGIVTRRSTDVQPVGDAAVAEALRFVRDRVGEPIQASSVARHVGLSRGMLDIRFRRAIGRSVAAEISRARFALVRGLLLNSDLPLKVIAPRAGYRSVEYLVTAFRRDTGQTPGVYRKANQLQRTPTVDSVTDVP